MNANRSANATADPGVDRPLRRDAEANRRRILRAASELMTERGLAVPLEDIAAAAEVGIGTLYRRFATRDDLVAAIFEDWFGAIIDDVEASFAIDDGWDAMVWFLRRASSRHVAKRVLTELLDHHTVTDQMGRFRAQLTPRFERLVERARATGRLRDDFEVGDLVMIQHMLGGVSEAAAALGEDVWGRYLVLLLDGIVASRSSATPAAVPAPTVAQLEAAFSRGGLGSRH